MTKKKAEKHRSYHCPSRREVADQIPRDLGEMGAKAKTSKKDWKWQRGVTSHLVSEGHWKKSHLTVWRWESEKHISGSIPVDGFRNHVAADGSPLGVSSRWGACGWSVVQVEHDEELRPMHGMYGTLDADVEVRRTIQRAEPAAFLCLLRKAICPIPVHIDNKGLH